MATSYSIASKPKSRRLPLPCWSPDETVALIEVYRDKWYSLRRGNLRAPDWQKVADGVEIRCNGQPPKTSIQCRHKMEKLRKRYRSEMQRIGNRYPSSWVHFKLMDCMESGTSSSDPSVNHDDEDADENEEEDMMLHPIRVNKATTRLYPGSVATGVRIKIPSFAAVPSVAMNSRYGPGKGLGVMKRKEEDVEKNDGNVTDAMVAAILKLGDGFVRMERMKMDMARELESMRMKAEIKQTEMILETHRKLWESFSERVTEKKCKKVKRMATPES
ncbi:hypothetical protein L1987_00895 [Smallanthus sonchifolius]|uniref:Uncharacterized protein n=1 Tax=Smallanthus sonchifolius TaxID=185202 RepID=A0ACB9K3L0_9ASTR|nr:hypothetical protein L1987_00895 [Smallanthus sonchifolius]